MIITDKCLIFSSNKELSKFLISEAVSISYREYTKDDEAYKPAYSAIYINGGGSNAKCGFGFGFFKEDETAQDVLRALCSLWPRD